MPQGSKAAYSAKQKKQAQHIEASYEQQGIPAKKAEAIAWATVNKQSGGGERSGSGSGSGRYKSEQAKAEARSDSAHNAVETKHDKAKPNALENQTKPELLAKARAQNISGRSTMNKQELILAIRRLQH